MKSKKFLAGFLMATMLVASVPGISFAQGTNRVESVLKVSSESTTSPSLDMNQVDAEEAQKVYVADCQKVDNGEIKSSYEISYKWNDAWFFNDHTLFNHELARTSFLLTQLAYYSSASDLEQNGPEAATYQYGLQTEDGFFDIMDVMKAHGLVDVEEHNFRTTHDDHHVAQFNIGHKTVTQDGQTKELITLAIRGTRSEREWLSNGDLGVSTEFDQTEEWTNEKNLKGFDITSNRIMKVVNDYMSANGISEENATFWITGHSRGAGIANVLAQKLEARDMETFTYAFATPNTTESQDAASYKSIFNIVSKDDIVPAIPVEGWGFTKYGQVAKVSLTSSAKKEWAEMTGLTYKSALSLTLKNTIEELGDLADDRDELRSYDHDDNTITKTYFSASSRTKALNEIPAVLLPYCEITTYQTKFLGKTYYKFDMKQQPNYFVQAALLNLAGSMSDLEFLGFDVASAYSSAKASIIAAGLGGISHPHYIETYRLLTEYSDFSKYFDVVEAE